MRLILALRAFLATLFRAQFADQIEALLAGNVDQEPQVQPVPTPVVSSGCRRSDALTLLATMQREARFVDLVSEPLGNYSDAQIGAAARDVLRDCGTVLERMFELKPLLAEGEGSEVQVAEGFDPGRYRLTGNVSGQPPFQGRLVHHGWEATKCELPSWSGSDAVAQIVTAAEVELV